MGDYDWAKVDYDLCLEYQNNLIKEWPVKSKESSTVFKLIVERNGKSFEFHGESLDEVVKIAKNLAHDSYSYYGQKNLSDTQMMYMADFVFDIDTGEVLKDKTGNNGSL